jgi:hypothetical protein
MAAHSNLFRAATVAALVLAGGGHPTALRAQSGIVHLLCHADGYTMTQADGKRTFVAQKMSGTLQVDYDRKTAMGLGAGPTPLSWQYRRGGDELFAEGDLFLLDGSRQQAGQIVMSVERLSGQVTTMQVFTGAGIANTAWQCEAASTEKATPDEQRPSLAK